MLNRFKHRACRAFVIIITIVFCIPAYPQTAIRKVTRESALDAYSAGNFERAYNDFSELLTTFPKDPLYKYYSGVSLVRLHRDPVRAVSLLSDAAAGPAEIKPVPADVWFYLGRAQQMSGNFREAIKSYDVFSDKAGRKSAKGYEVADYVNECKEGKGELSGYEVLQAAIEEKSVPGVLPGSSPQTDENIVRPAEDLPADYEGILIEAMSYQVRADSLMAVAAAYRKHLETVPADQKAMVRSRITEIESQAARYQKLSDQAFSATVQKSDTTTGNKEKVSEVIPGAIEAQQGVMPGEKASGEKEDLVQSTPPPVMVQQEEVYSLFEIVTDAGRAAKNVIEIDPQLPSGLIYRLQVAVFSKPVAPSVFKGMTPVAGFSVKGSEVKRYYAGMFRRASDAGRALLAVKQLGFRDAFLTAILDGAPVSLDRAALLEKEWGSRTLEQRQKQNEISPVEAGPPTLIFKVEILRSVKPVKDEMAESFRKIAGSRGLEVVNTNDGNIAYLIGKFITFDSAFDYADLLVRNGYREARVSAWLGSREIPVETAKELFDKQ